MSSETKTQALLRRRRMSRAVPWVIWGAALVVALWMWRDVSGAGVAPAEAEIRQVSVSSLRAARVLEVKVEPGVHVEEGQILAALDPTQVDAEHALAKVELERLQAQIAAEGVTLHASGLETAERLAGDAEKARLTVAQLQADAQRDRSELAQLAEQITGQQKLVDERLASAGTLNELKLRHATLSQAVEESSKTLREARAHVAAAEQRVGAWRQGKATAAPQGEGQGADKRLAPLRTSLKAQLQRLSQLEQQREAMILRAPIMGTVSTVWLRPGDTAQAMQPVVTVVDDHPRQVIAYADQMWAARVQVGDSARLRPSDGSGSIRRGQVVSLGASISELPLRFRPVPTQPSYCRQVYIRLQDEDDSPLPGQAFDATFTRGSR